MNGITVVVCNVREVYERMVVKERFLYFARSTNKRYHNHDSLRSPNVQANGSTNMGDNVRKVYERMIVQACLLTLPGPPIK